MTSMNMFRGIVTGIAFASLAEPTVARDIQHSAKRDALLAPAKPTPKAPIEIDPDTGKAVCWEDGKGHLTRPDGHKMCVIAGTANGP